MPPSKADQAIDDILYAAQQIVGIGKDGLSACPVPGLPAAASALYSIIGMVIQTRGNTQTRKELAENIKTIAEIIHKTYNRAEAMVAQDGRTHRFVHSPELDERVKALTERLTNLETEATKLKQEGKLSKFVKSKSNAETLVRLRQGIDAATQRFSLEGQITIEQLLNGVVDELNKKALQNLPFVNARYSSSLNPTISGVLKGTREGILNELTQWTNGPDENGYDPILFVLSGGAGTGKSTIAFEMAKRLDNLEPKSLGASFFFIHNAGQLNTTRHVLPTLAYQLATSQPELRPYISAAVREYTDQGKHGQQLEFDLKDLIINPLKNVTSHHRVIMILDALDECTETGQDDVVRLLYLFVQHLPSLPFQLRVLVTTRPEMHIERALDSVDFQNALKPFRMQDIPQETADADIRLYLEQELGALSSKEELFIGYPSVIKDLTKRAEGLFIYAATVIRFLEQDTPGAIDTLKQLLTTENPIEGAYILTPLDKLYLAILETTFDPREPKYPRIQEDVRTFLGSLALLQDHVSAAVLRDLVGVDVKITEYIQGLLGSVILSMKKKGKMDRNGNIWMLHTSFPQFLTDNKRCTNQTFYIDLTIHHTRLTVRCLEVIIKESLLIENICKPTDPLLSKTDIPDLQKHVKKYIPAHLQYACIHWATHLAQSEATGDLLVLIEKFATINLLAWAEGLSYLNRLGDAIPAILTAIRWLKYTQANNNVLEVLDNAHRFILEFFTPIGVRPNELYNSALSFAPHCRLTDIYAGGTRRGNHNAVRLVTPRNPTWGSCLRVIETGARVNCLEFSPDGLWIASGSDNGNVQIWDSGVGTLKNTMVGNALRILSIAWAPDGRSIVSGTDDRTFHVWNVASGAEIHQEFVGDRKSITYTQRLPAVSKESILSDDTMPSLQPVSDSSSDYSSGDLSDDSDESSGKKLKTGAIAKVAWNVNGKQIVCVTGGGVLQVWDVIIGESIGLVKSVPGLGNVMAISKDCKRVVDVNRPTVRLWDVEGGKAIKEMKGHMFEVSSAAFVHDDTQVVLGTASEAIVWDSASGDLIHSWEVTSEKIAASRNVIAACDNASIQLFNTTTWQSRGRLTPLPGLGPVSISPDGERLVSSSHSSIELWDLSQPLSEPPTKQSDVIRVSFSPDGSHIAALTEDTILTWSSGSLFGGTPHIIHGFYAAFSPDSKKLVAIDRYNNISLWTLKPDTPKLSNTLSTEMKWTRAVAWSPNGRFITGVAGAVLGVLDTATGRLLKKIDLNLKNRRPKSIYSEFSMDNSIIYLKLYGWDNTAEERMYNWQEGRNVVVKTHKRKMAIESKQYSEKDGWIVRKDDGKMLCWIPASRRAQYPHCTWQGQNHFATFSGSGQLTILNFG